MARKCIEKYLETHKSNYIGKYRCHSAVQTKKFEHKFHYYILDIQFKAIDVFVTIDYSGEEIVPTFSVNLHEQEQEYIIKDALKEISELDNIYLTINIFEGEEDCPVLKDKTEGDIESFLNHYKIYIDDEEDEEYTLKLSVSKKVHKNKITIYNKESLFKYLKNLKLKETMSVYSKQLKNDVFFMEFLEEVDPVNSSSIYMSKENYFNLDENQIEQIRESRKNNIDIRRKLCNFIGGYSLDYKDFKFNNISDQDINDIFNKLECIMCLIYIGNRSEFINDDKVRISITGQTTTKFELDYKNLVVGESLNQFFKICNWTITRCCKNIISFISCSQFIINFNSNR